MRMPPYYCAYSVFQRTVNALHGIHRSKYSVMCIMTRYLSVDIFYKHEKKMP